MFLLLKSSTREHNLAKWIRCEMYTPKEGERGTSPSRKGNLNVSKLKMSSLSYILAQTMFNLLSETVCIRIKGSQQSYKNRSKWPKWYIPLHHPKRITHTKFGIPTSNNIRQYAPDTLILESRSTSEWNQNGPQHITIQRCIGTPNLGFLPQIMPEICSWHDHSRK